MQFPPISLIELKKELLCTVYVTESTLKRHTDK